MANKQKSSRQAAADAPATGKKKHTINTIPLYIAIVLLFIAYFLFQRTASIAIILGAAIFFLIIVLLVIEVSNGVKEEGMTKNAIEIILAVVVVVVFWYGLRFVLNTSYPLDVVPSCSMLPTLQRGDMIVLQGATQNTLKAPIVNVTASQWASSFGSFPSTSFECVAYNISGGRAQIGQFILPGYSIGLLETNGSSAEVLPPGYQQTGLVKYQCGAVSVELQNKTIVQEASTTAITIGNTTISGDRNNSIVVYQTIPQDEFYQEGDSYIVHRVYAIINASGSYYILTKGDNNPGLDIQYSNYPASIGQVNGEVIASIPYIGYLKLILSNSFSEPAGCNYTTLG